MDIIWSNIKWDSQYQIEEVQDWASHLEHLQSILVEFDVDGALGKSNLIQFFQEGLKPLIKAQMEPRSQEYDSWDELVKKTVAAEAKANLKPSYYSQDMDNCCPKRNRPSHTILSKYQSSRDNHPEKEKTWTLQVQKKLTWSPSSGSPWPDNDDSAKKKACKEKKKKFRKDSSTPATSFNATSTNGNRDLSQVVCFNCNKKGHLLRNCSKPKKDTSKN